FGLGNGPFHEAGPRAAVQPSADELVDAGHDEHEGGGTGHDRDDDDHIFEFIHISGSVFWPIGSPASHRNCRDRSGRVRPNAVAPGSLAPWPRWSPGCAPVSWW